MSATIYTEAWEPFRYLVDALLRAKPMAVQVRPYEELDHPVVRDQGLQSTFVAYNDELGVPTFSFLSVAEALDRKFPDVRLCGDTPLMRAKVRSACQIIDEGHLMLAASCMPEFARYDGPIWHVSSRAPEAMLETYEKKMAIMDRLAEDDGYLLSRDPMLCDVIIAACSWFAADKGLDPIPAGLPKLQAWHRRNCVEGIFARD